MAGPRDKGPKGKDAFQEIELRLGGLLGALGEALEQAGKRAAEGQSFESNWNGGDGPIRASAGIRVGSAAGAMRAGHDPVRPVNTPKRGQEAIRKAHLDVHDDPEEWCVTVELPGVAADEISFTARDGTLRVETTGQRRFAAETPLPADLDPDSLALSFRNGIAEISATRGRGQ